MPSFDPPIEVPVVNTRKLFVWLARLLDATVVCEVGAMDGSDTLYFAGALPGARVFAYEANPENYAALTYRAERARGRVETACVAVADYDGDAVFHVLPWREGDPRSLRGMSSLLARSGVWGERSVPVPVTVRRLDSLLRLHLRPDDRAALWIDAEGAGHSVLLGLGAVAPRVHLVHIEVEQVPCIAEGQRLATDIDKLLRSMGLAPIASDAPAGREQRNMLYLREDLSATLRWWSQGILGFATVRGRALRGVRALLGDDRADRWKRRLQRLDRRD